MKSLNTYISEKLLINKNFKNVSFDNLDLPTKLVRFYLVFHEHDNTYQDGPAVDKDNWHRIAQITTANVKEFEPDNKECKIDWSSGSNGFDGKMKIYPSGQYVYDYDVRHGGLGGSPTHNLDIILNPNNSAIIDGINKILDLYRKNEITEYADHYAEFKININDMLNMFDIELPNEINKKCIGNYLIKMYKTDEYEKLQEYIEK